MWRRASSGEQGTLSRQDNLARSILLSIESDKTVVDKSLVFVDKTMDVLGFLAGQARTILQDPSIDYLRFALGASWAIYGAESYLS